MTITKTEIKSIVWSRMHEPLVKSANGGIINSIKSKAISMKHFIYKMLAYRYNLCVMLHQRDGSLSRIK